MSRIESSGSTPVPIDTSPDAAPASSSPRAKEPHTPASEARNELRAYGGPLAQPSRAPAPGTAPSSPGPSVSAGELAALGGRLRPAASEVPSALYADLRSHLTRSLGNLLINGSDVKAVHTALGTLPPAAYRAALERMERDGLLGEYVKAQDAGSRQAFLEQAESKGLLQRLKGEPASGPLGYPGTPDFFRNDPRLPEPMRDAVNAHAIHAGVGFYRAHGEYLGRYAEAAGQAKSLPELRELGEPREALLRDKLLGLEARDPARERYAKEWRRGIGQPESCNRAYQAVTARKQELLGQRPAGSIELTGKAELVHQSFKVNGEAQLDSRGKVGLVGETGVAVKGGPVGLEVTRDTDGKTKTELKVDLGLAGFSRRSDGELEVSLGVGKHFEAYAMLNPEEAEFGGGIRAGVEGEQSEAGLEAGFSMKGLTASAARQAVDLRRPGFFERPRELDQGTAWDALSQARRAACTQEGWTREAWTRALRR